MWRARRALPSTTLHRLGCDWPCNELIRGETIITCRADGQRSSELRVRGFSSRHNVSHPGLLLLFSLWEVWTSTGPSDSFFRKSTLKSLSTYAKEHFTNAAYGAYPIENDSKIAIIIVSNKYSPNNFW